MLVAGVALLVGGLMLVRWFVAADPRTLAFAAKVTGIACAVLVAGFLIFSGRAGWIMALVPFAVFLLRRGGLGSRLGGGWFGGMSGGAPRDSHVRTRFLDMRLDHETGELDGDILDGPYAGRRLGTMDRHELLDLLADVRAEDRKSALVLEAYIDRRFPDWREGAGSETADAGGAGPDTSDAGSGSGAGSGTAAAGPMTVAEAYRVLGLEPGAGEVEIKAAYHRLIGTVHPDRGGSAFLAAQVNRARDILLGRTGRTGRS
jgi:DnaJ-like protein